jgi:hypothetical protein
VLGEFLSGLLLKLWKGSGAVKGLLSKEGAHSLGWDRHVGNERLDAISVSWPWEIILPVDLCNFPVSLAKPKNPFLGGV